MFSDQFLDELRSRTALVGLVGLLDLGLFVIEGVQHLAVLDASVVVAFDRALDRTRWRDRGADVESGDELDLVDGDEVGRVGHREREGVAVATDRDDVVLRGQDRRQDARHVGRDLDFCGIDDRESVLLAEELDQPLLGETGGGDQRRRDRAPSVAHPGLGGDEILAADEPLAQEEVAQPAAGRASGRRDRLVRRSRNALHLPLRPRMNRVGRCPSGSSPFLSTVRAPSFNAKAAMRRLPERVDATGGARPTLPSRTRVAAREPPV